MCYEFVHCCNDELKHELAAVLHSDNYCLCCMNEINYLYVNSADTTRVCKNILATQKIKLYKLQADEMLSVIDFPGLEQFWNFYGNRLLLEGLRHRYRSTDQIQLV